MAVTVVLQVNDPAQLLRALDAARRNLVIDGEHASQLDRVAAAVREAVEFEQYTESQLMEGIHDGYIDEYGEEPETSDWFGGTS